MEEQKKLLIKKAQDALRICEIKNVPKFVGFLSPGEAAAVFEAVGKVKGSLFYGGYDMAERRIFGILPEYLEGEISAFPIKAIEITFNTNYSLTHRDVLGALMSTGVERSVIGDILILNGKAYVFVLEDMAGYFENQITKIAKVGVTLKVLDDLNLVCTEKTQKTTEIRFTVSSARLDAIVSGLTGESRSVSEKLISDGLVFVNSFEVLKPTKKVQDGDTVTVRRFGKFTVNMDGNVSKKGREIITAQKYI